MSFTLFSDLPTEIRLNIWELSARERRIIKIESHIRHFQVDSFMTDHSRIDSSITITGAIPGIASANRESRSVARRESHHVLLSLAHSTGWTMHTINMNFERDFIFAVGCDAFDAFAVGHCTYPRDEGGLINRSTRHVIQNVMVDTRGSIQGYHSKTKLFAVLDTLIMDHSHVGNYWPGWEPEPPLDVEGMIQVEEERIVTEIVRVMEEDGKKVPEIKFLDSQEMEMMWVESMGM